MDSSNQCAQYKQKKKNTKHDSRDTVVPHYKYCYSIHIANITSILFSAIIAFLVVMLLQLTVSRKSRNNLELAAKN